MPYDLAGLLIIGSDVLTTTVNQVTRKILAQLGNVVGEVVDSDNVEWWQHVGLSSRPSKPTKGKAAAQVLGIRRGDHDICFASQDVRCLEIYGALDHGETCLHAGGEDGKAQARILLKKDGSINLLTKKGNTAAGAGVGVFVNADGSITALGTEGAAVMLGADGSIRAFNASGALQITSSGGVKLSSKDKVDISAPAVTLGGPTALPVAIAPPVLAAIAAMQTEIAAVAAGLAALGSDPTHVLPATATAVGAAATAVTTATTALSAITSRIASQRTSTD